MNKLKVGDVFKSLAANELGSLIKCMGILPDAKVLEFSWVKGKNKGQSFILTQKVFASSMWIKATEI